MDIDQLVKQRFQELKEQNKKAGIKLWMPFGPKMERKRIRGEIEAELGVESAVEKIRKTIRKKATA